MDTPELDPIILAPGEGPQLNVLGDNQCVKLTGEQTNGLMTLVENENMPGTALPLHWHDNEDETFYILQGEVEFNVDGQRMLMTEGSAVYAPRGVPHAWKVVGTKPARMMLVVTPGGLDKMFEELAELCGDRCEAVTPPMDVVMGVCARYGIHFPPMASK
jgi:quercetin dioxygenase-like cupin family protein